jgi:hypothetical protein
MTIMDHHGPWPMAHQPSTLEALEQLCDAMLQAGQRPRTNGTRPLFPGPSPSATRRRLASLVSSCTSLPCLGQGQVWFPDKM